MIATRERLAGASSSDLIDVILAASEELKRRGRPPVWDLLDGVARIFGEDGATWCLYREGSGYAVDMVSGSVKVTGEDDTPMGAAVVACSLFRSACQAQSGEKVGSKA